MIRINGHELIQVDPVGETFVKKHGTGDTSLLFTAACNKWLLEHGQNPHDGAFRNRTRGEANAARARKAKR